MADKRPDPGAVPSDAAARPDDEAVAPDRRAPGWREAIGVGIVVVVVVLGLAVLTSVLPTSLQDVVFRTPLAIVVLLGGTVGLLVWVTRRPTPKV